MTARALFLDRDGVINLDRGYVHLPEDFELVPGIVNLLRAARERGFILLVVTNQSGLARGLFDASQYAAIETHMRTLLAQQGVCLDGVYHCPHHPEGSVAEFAFRCDCRKPAPGMILRAAADHNVDLASSILIGDKASDIKAGSAAGVGACFLVDPARPEEAFARIQCAIEASSPA